MLKPKPKDDGLTKPFLIQLEAVQDGAIEGERRARGLKSRSETIRALVGEGLHRARRLREKGKRPELTNDAG